MKQPFEDLRIYDGHQFEFKMTYPLDREKKVNEYSVDAFLFIPYSLGSNGKNYSFDDFFCDGREYVRFKTPVIKLKNLCSGEGSTPLRKLKESIGRSLPPDDPASFVSRLRTFCSIVRAAFRDAEAAIEKNSDKLDDDRLKDEIAIFTTETHGAAAAFRAVRNRIKNDDDEKLFDLADEFISLECTNYLNALGLFLRSKGRFSTAVQTLVSDAMHLENEYRRRMKFRSDPSTKEGLESIVRRENLLKRLMAGVLFLKVDTFRDGVIMENLMLSLAAGIAMAFSTVVAFLSNGMIQEFSIAFFVLTVLAYMFKDRIKDLIRLYAFSRFRRFSFDFISHLTNVSGERVGVCRERLRFISEKDLDEDAANIRDASLIRKFGPEAVRDNIVHFRKTIKIYSKHCENIFADFKADGIVDIIRFDVSKLLKKMSDPAKTILIPAQDAPDVCEDAGLLKTVIVPHIYPLEIIVGTSAKGQAKTYRHVRLNMTRNGIYSAEELPL